TYIIPPATTGPGPSNDAPVPGTPFTVSKLRFASNVQITSPVSAEYARNPPSADPENTAPGTAVTAAACVALQRGPGGEHSSGCGGVYHRRSPVLMSIAWMPPVSSLLKPPTATYMRSPSTALPQTPPTGPPGPAR